MATGVHVKFDGMDAEQFDELEAGHGARADAPAALILHASGPLDGAAPERRGHPVASER